MAAPSPEEQRTLTIIQDFEFRVAQYSNNHRKLQEYLSGNLVPLLEKARDIKLHSKLVQAANRIQTFTNSSSVVFPVSALVDQFKSNADYTFVRYFDITFIRHSIDNLPVSEKTQLLSHILKGISADQGRYLDALFNIFLRVLRDLKIPPRGISPQFRSECGLDDPKDAEYVANWLGKLFFVVRGNKEQSLRRGLTEAEYAFLTLPAAKGIWREEREYKGSITDADRKALSFTDTCDKAARFLESDAFTDRERLLPALYASTHPKATVASLGNDMLKRTSISVEDAHVIDELFATYPICGHVTRTRILRLLTKSREAATKASRIVKIFTVTFSELAPDSHDSFLASEEDTAPETPPQGGAKPTSIPLAENVKAFLGFLDWVATTGLSTDELRNLSFSVWNGLHRVLTNYLGWPQPHPWRQTPADLELRCRIYETIGKVVKACPRPESRTSHILLWFLQALELDDSSADAAVYLNGAVSAITSVFLPRDKRVRQELAAAMVRNMLAPRPTPRHALTKVANDCLPFDNIAARWVDILASSRVLDGHADVVDEGRRGLDPWTYRRDMDGARLLPDWRTMALTYLSGDCARVYNHGPDSDSRWVQFEAVTPSDPSYRVHFEAVTPSDPSYRVQFEAVTPSDPSYSRDPDSKLDKKWAQALAGAVDYCQKMLYLTALPDFRIEPGWEGRLKVLVASDKKSRDKIRAYLSDAAHGPALLALLDESLRGSQLIDDKAPVAESLLRSFVDVASLVPSSVVTKIAHRAPELKPLLQHSRRGLRLLAARALGILAAHNTGDLGFQEAIVGSAGRKGAATEDPHFDAVFLGAAHVLSRQIYCGTKTRSEIDVRFLQCVPTLEGVPPSSLEFVTEAFLQLWTAGISAFGETEGTADRTALVTKRFIEPLGAHAKKGKEHAIKALGRLAIACDDSEILDLILAKLYDLHEIKQAEVHLAVGEAIAAAVTCWDSEAVELTLDVQSNNVDYRISKRSGKLVEVLDKLVADSKHTKPSLVKASGMVLYCIIQYCAQVEEVQARLRDFHFAFMRLLTARDDLVQETASRALALIYEIGDPSLKDSLVRDFVAFFTGSGQQLKEDEEPASDTAATASTSTPASSSRPGTSSISYKDIVRLANEAGDQKLVYKFMALANSAINWTSESAFGRFGLRDILSRPEVGVDEKLYPILFRSRFDPSPTTQKSMRAIWKAMVKDPTTVLDTHFDTIMTSLLKSMLGREWRVRQASCAAVKDLIEGQPFPKYRAYYKDMLAAALKLLDDMKDSVRLTALAFFSHLTQVLLKQLEDSGSSATTTAMMDEIVPFLLSDKGIDSSVADVKALAAKAIQDIAKRGGKSIRPYIVTIVPCLLGFLSTYEPEVINYAYQLSGQDTREELDKRRATAVFHSPIFESITNCLRYADQQTIKDLSPVLEDTLKSAVGMPTKVGCAGVIVHLADRHRDDFAPHVARFLRLMEKAVLDRNDTVSKNYCKAAAHLIRAAPSDDNRVQFVEHVLDLWFASEDEVRRRKVVDVILGIRHAAPDHFDSLEPLLLPFVFLGTNEHSDEYVHKQCEQLWSAVGGSPHKVARYVDELVALSTRSLGVGNWPVKHAGALTAGKVVTSLVEGRIANAKDLGVVWPVLEKALALKTFERKAELLEALASFAEAMAGLDNRPLAANDGQLAKDLKKIALREAKRNNDVYRPHAFRALHRVASALKVDMLDGISDVVGPSIVDFQETDDSSSSSSSSSSSLLRTLTVVAAIQAIFRGSYEPNLRSDPVGELARTIWALEKQAVNPKAAPCPATLTAHPLLARQKFEAIRPGHWYPLVERTLKAAAVPAETTTPAKRTSSCNGAGEKGRGTAVVRWFLATLDLERTQSGTEQQRLARVGAVEAVVGFWKGVVLTEGDGGRDGDGDSVMGEQAQEVEGFRQWVLPLLETAMREERADWGRERWGNCLKLVRGGE